MIGVGTGVDDLVTTVSLDADRRLEELVHPLCPCKASHPGEKQGVAKGAAPPRHVRPVISTVVQAATIGIANIVGRKPIRPNSRSQRLGLS